MGARERNECNAIMEGTCDVVESGWEMTASHFPEWMEFVCQAKLERLGVVGWVWISGAEECGMEWNILIYGKLTDSTGI